MNLTTEQNLNPAKLFSTAYCPPHTDYQNRSPVIFVHGLGATNGTWKAVKEIIANNIERKIICIDLRNHGKSEWPEVFTLDHTVLDLENFMEEQEISKAILLGHSFGGRVALGLAFKRPDLVERLILEDTFLRISGVYDDLFKGSSRMLEAMKKFPKMLSEKEAQDIIWKHAETAFPELVQKMRQKVSCPFPFYKDKKTGYFKFYFDLDLQSKFGNCEFDLSSNSTYNGETLLMVAEKSNSNKMRDLEELRKFLPNSREVCIAGCVHTMHLENPSQFIEVTSKFINGDIACV